MSHKACRICGSCRGTVVHDGPIRDGRFGNMTRDNHQVVCCEECGAGRLEGMASAPENYYESDEYRKSVDGAAEVQEYFKTHDREQNRNLEILGPESFRDKTVVDIGCGAGSFLDLVSGFAERTIAIEPSERFRSSLAARGYAVYPYTHEALAKEKGAVDIAVSFFVLEHIADPLTFLREAHRLLADKGRLLLSTPNADDALLEALPDEYSRFYYRKAHLWYFNRIALKGLLKRAGFTNVEIVARQRFGLSNFLGWMRDRAPMGEVDMGFVTEAVDAVWKRELERTYRADILYAVADK